MLVAETAEARAAQLLEAHLTPGQRAEYAALGRVTIVKRGLVWGILLRDAAKLLPVAALLAIPGWRLQVLALLATLVLVLAPFWRTRFLLASTRRREWILSPRTSPILVARGRRTRFCVAFQEYLPPGDRVLAWKHLVELSEGHLLRTANVR